jgi:adenosylcobinamide-GDP ribazoletransferase
MIRRFLGAIQFLTVLPVRGATASPGSAAPFFPLIGAAVGWIGCGLFLAIEPWLGSWIAALMVVAFWSAITGAIHEDGLADVADAFRAHRPQGSIYKILRDPRVGTFGALALIFSVCLRWQALPNLSAPLLPSFVAAQAIPRAATVVLGYVSRPVGHGMGAQFCGQLSFPGVLAASVQGAAAALWCGWRPGLVILCLTGAVLIASQIYFDRRLGGVNGDCLGAAAQVVEITILLVLACRNCTW